jgi:hypothetical protein
MLMGKQNGIEFSNGVLQHLLSKIRAAINHNRTVVPLHQNRGPQPFVAGVIALANRVMSTYDGYAL